MIFIKPSSQFSFLLGVRVEKMREFRGNDRLGSGRRDRKKGEWRERERERKGGGSRKIEGKAGKTKK